MILRAIEGAAAVIAVSAALQQALVEIGAPEAKITVLRNGVDTALFRPPPIGRPPAPHLGFTRPTLISVGLLIERKGHHRTIEAMTQLPDFDLVIVGEGPERDRLNALIARLGLGDRVRLMGARPHAELPLWYGAADASVLSSSREGWANVLLEFDGVRHAGGRQSDLGQSRGGSHACRRRDHPRELGRRDRRGRARACSRRCRRARQPALMPNRSVGTRRPPASWRCFAG